MPALTRNQYDVLVALISWTLGFLPLFLHKLPLPPRWRMPRLTWMQAVGLALVASPFVRMGLNLYLSIGALFTFTVLEPVSEAALWRSVGRDLLFELALPVVGLLLLHNALPGFASRRAPRGGVHELLSTHGLAPKRSWRRDALRGFTLFFCIAAAYAVAYGVSGLFSAAAAGGDESRYWIHITVPLIVLVSGTAGITEELLFRGVLLSRLARWMPLGAAALLQAVLFGFIHAGYGTWTHVVGPLMFGLGMAWIARTLGILPAMILHLQINVVFFAFDVADVVPQAWALLVALGIVNVYAAMATRFDAVAILWRSLREGVRRPARLLRHDDAPEADAPGAT